MKLFGIRIRIDRTFWLLPAFFALWVGKDYGVEAGARMFVLILLIFACVLGHEFSHGLVAQRLGVRVPYVTLYPMGGVATMVDMPRKPGHEFLISLVGPLFNFALAALLYIPMLYLIGHDALFSPSIDSWEGVAAGAYWANPVLGAFNLIPAFPMDGGRMLRAALSKFMRRLTATRVAVFLGQGFAILFFLQGIWERQIMLSMVGAYVFFSASQEMKVVKHEPSA